MIEKVYGDYVNVCDFCGEQTKESWGAFQDAVDGSQDLGWEVVKINEDWEDICPSCQDNDPRD